MAPCSRRALLSAAGVASSGVLAGCLDSAPAAEETSARPSPSTSPTPTPVVTRSVAVGSSDGLPDDARIGLSVDVPRPVSNAEHPAAIEVTLTNEGSQRLVVETYYERVFSDEFSNDGGDLYLVDADPGVSRTGLRSCWRVAAPTPTPEPALAYDNDLEPGESVSKTQEVWTAPATDGCLPPGTYPFGGRYAVYWNLDREEMSSTSHDWGFSIEIRRR